jgi:G3E family GTPase
VEPDADLIPVHIITGFLGSGKTTLLRRVLASPTFANAAVVVNEFGEIPLDHLLLARVDADTVVLSTGCVCCTLRTELGQALRELYDKRERGRVPPFDRLALETTGLADPAPILFTLMADPVLRHHFRLGTVVTTVDAVNGGRHLAEHLASVKQVAVADRLVLTKTDLADRGGVDRLRSAVRRLNPMAPLVESPSESLAPDRLFSTETSPPADGAERDGEPAHGRVEAPTSAGGEQEVDGHAREIGAVSLTVDAPVDWTAFGVWLTMLLHAHGDAVLRVKGILCVRDVPGPVVVHGVHHLVHPPTVLTGWPTADHRSRVVLIVRRLSAAALERSWRAFLGLALPARWAAEEGPETPAARRAWASPL